MNYAYERGVEQLDGYHFPVCILWDVDRYSEMVHFNIINTRQRKMSTDIVDRHLVQIKGVKGLQMMASGTRGEKEYPGHTCQSNDLTLSSGLIMTIHESDDVLVSRRAERRVQQRGVPLPLVGSIMRYGNRTREKGPEPSSGSVAAARWNGWRRQESPPPMLTGRWGLHRSLMRSASHRLLLRFCLGELGSDAGATVQAPMGPLHRRG